MSLSLGGLRLPLPKLFPDWASATLFPHSGSASFEAFYDTVSPQLLGGANGFLWVEMESCPEDPSLNFNFAVILRIPAAE